ncbi:MAG TPA: TolC family protein [Verrucomicrobiae bacterium]|nr:TolC family protein [Verrucomicrobiae bacterium]
MAHGTIRLTRLAWAVVACTTAWSAPPPALTVAAAVREAQENNPEIRALSAGVAAARGEVTTANTWDNPSLSALPGLRRSEPSGGPSSREFDGVFELTQTFEFPGKRSLRRALAEKDVELRELALTAFREQLDIQVRRSFYTLLVFQQVLALKEQGVTLSKTFLEAARKRVANGFASEFDATKAEVEVVTAQKALGDAQAQRAAARAALSTLLGRRPDTDFEVTGALSAVVIVPPETTLLQQVAASNPSLKIQVTEVERTGLNLRSVRKSRLPDFTVGPSVEYLPDEQTYQFGITLPLPLWDRKSGEIATATAEQQSALAELEKLQQEVLRDVTTAYHNLVSARESLALFTPEFFAKLKRALDDAGQGYAGGRTPLLIYLETQRTYFDARADYFDSLQKLYDAQAALETAAGMPLSELQEKAK